MKKLIILLLTLILPFYVSCQKKPFYLSSLNAGKNFPLYTTYAAAKERSDFVLDEGYVFRYDSDSSGADFTTDTGGDICLGFQKGGKWVYRVADMYKPPVITTSYPDLVKYEYEPFRDIKVSVLFMTYSSRTALLDLTITNKGKEKVEINLFPFMRSGKRFFHSVSLEKKENMISFSHEEYPDDWTLSHDLPFVDSIRNIFMLSAAVDEAFAFSSEDSNISGSDFSQYVKNKIYPENIPATARIVSLQTKLILTPSTSQNLRIIRSVSSANEPQDSALVEIKNILKIDIKPFIEINEKLLSKVKTFDFQDEKQNALFWSNVNMMRQCFYPPQAKSAYNYYVFSREPTWGWGHGGQVFHESIAMLAYADVDPEGAMNSQRVYLQRQYPNGYINYRTGSFLDEIINYNGELTSSAPWYSWLNWEVYKMTRDKKFLKEMYGSSVKFYNFYTANRDKDGDGLCEWGGDAVLESVRDALVAVWDKVGYPANFEGLDLNCMLVMEAKSLEAMARELGLYAEAGKWKADYEKRTELINKYCWDKETGFYYNVNKIDHSFTFKTPNDLKRMEIIGFLPLWAGIANEEQAGILVSHLTNPKKFWRKYGIPSLAADDNYYNDKGYWNGPVWVQWNYLIMNGLFKYGYKKEAKQLVDKVSSVMYDRLGYDHNLWEFYSPDDLWGGYHKTYIWAGIVNRMMKEVNSQK
jgi:hypothetical protein